MILQIRRYIPTEADMLEFGKKLAKTCENQGIWIYLRGELGAGKTTLVRGFLQGIGYEKRVKSPTYTLVEPYEVNDKLVYHFDFYRISESAELAYLGLGEYFTQTSICLVEWADHFLEQLPTPDILISFTSHNPGRQLEMESKTLRGAAVMERYLNG